MWLLAWMHWFRLESGITKIRVGGYIDGIGWDCTGNGSLYDGRKNVLGERTTDIAILLGMVGILIKLVTSRHALMLEKAEKSSKET
jgi:hypothetical protein